MQESRVQTQMERDAAFSRLGIGVDLSIFDTAPAVARPPAAADSEAGSRSEGDSEMDAAGAESKIVSPRQWGLFGNGHAVTAAAVGADLAVRPDLSPEAEASSGSLLGCCNLKGLFGCFGP